MSQATHVTHVMNTYARQPIAFVRGEGVWLWDESGKRYLDALAGIAVNTLGHAHPVLTRAIAEQAAKIIHSSNLFRIPLQERAADLLAEVTGLDEVFFCNSGCEANEAAIKLARLYGHQRGVATPHIIVMENAFHGRTIATLSATGSRKVQAGFEPLVPGFVRVPLNDIDTVRAIAERDTSVVAVMIEPIQGEGGINVSRLEYLRALHALCQEKEWLFISDEVQCGLGRTGKWFVYQHAGFMPDVVPLAKGLAGGVAVGACITGGRAKGLFKPGHHGSTFGGNPLAMAVGQAVLDVLLAEGFLDEVKRKGLYLKQRLASVIDSHPDLVDEVRGEGLLVGVRCKVPVAEVNAAMRAEDMLGVGAGENVIRLLPPLNVSDAELDEGVRRFDAALAALDRARAG